jgi:hypothetical protein
MTFLTFFPYLTLGGFQWQWFLTWGLLEWERGGEGLVQAKAK